jgi:hypothetical protein
LTSPTIINLWVFLVVQNASGNFSQLLNRGPDCLQWVLSLPLGHSTLEVIDLSVLTTWLIVWTCRALTVDDWDLTETDEEERRERNWEEGARIWKRQRRVRVEKKENLEGRKQARIYVSIGKWRLLDLVNSK